MVKMEVEIEIGLLETMFLCSQLDEDTLSEIRQGCKIVKNKLTKVQDATISFNLALSKNKFERAKKYSAAHNEDLKDCNGCLMNKIPVIGNLWSTERLRNNQYLETDEQLKTEEGKRVLFLKNF
jgi:hypothetical protein